MRTSLYVAIVIACLFGFGIPATFQDTRLVVLIGFGVLLFAGGLSDVDPGTKLRIVVASIIGTAGAFVSIMVPAIAVHYHNDSRIAVLLVFLFVFVIGLVLKTNRKEVEPEEHYERETGDRMGDSGDGCAG